MTDKLDALKAALQAGPEPDPRAKADAIALAMKNFDDLQGSSDPLRPNSDRPNGAGFWNRIAIMLKGFTTKQALAGTASVAAICVAVVLIDRGPAGVGLSGPVTGVQPEVGPAPELEAPVKPMAEPSPEGRMQVPAQAEPEPAEDDLTSQEVNEAMVKDTAVAEPLATTTQRARQETSAEADRGGAALPVAPAPTSELADTMAGGEIGMAQKSAPSEGGAVAGIIAGDMEQFAAPASAPEMMPSPEPDTEAFANEAPNPVKVTAEDPVSTFSIDVDTASYAVVRNSLNMGMLPPAEAVRIEEMVNYFPYAYPAPTVEDGPFKPTVTVMPTPWNPDTRLVQIGVQGALPEMADRPPLNLVFLIDTSGSMEEPNKLPLLQQSLSLMLGQLRPQDQVAIVAYAGSAGLVLEPTYAKDVSSITAALNNLEAGGSTAGAEGLELAYRVAAGMTQDGEVSRVVLATDGDFNVGVSDPDGLEAYVAKKRETGIYLSVLGFGRSNLDDAVMQSLAQNGNGTAAYIDTLNEARKVLVDQLTGALFPIADDVKIQVEWNPAAVAEYRLIGYETRALRREDFNNDKIDAGEIGAGISVTAIYEVTAPGSAALLNDPLRYEPVGTAGDAGELGFLRLRYKEPGADKSILKETPIRQEMAPSSDDARFAAAIAGFGQLLTGATYLGDWGWDQAIALALAARGDDPFGYRIEAVNLMRMAQNLSGK
jgi:Ca-activated chloride channel family protein